MTLGIGIDYGTSNSAAASFDGETLCTIDLDAAAAAPGGVMPTALYLDRKRSATVGQPAIDRYIRENVGRKIELAREDVGELAITVADTDDTKVRGEGLQMVARVHAFTDQGQPGRLFRGVKRWLANEKLKRVRVFGSDFRVVSLVTPVLSWLAARTRALGEHHPVYVGRPIRYEGAGADGDRVAVERMREACRYAGFATGTLWPEPTAASQSFLRRARDAQSRTLLTFDFGGGTLDLALLRARGEEFELLGVDGLGLGGDELNRIVYRAVVFPELGEGLVHRVAVMGPAQASAVPVRALRGTALELATRLRAEPPRAARAHRFMPCARGPLRGAGSDGCSSSSPATAPTRSYRRSKRRSSRSRARTARTSASPISTSTCRCRAPRSSDCSSRHSRGWTRAWTGCSPARTCPPQASTWWSARAVRPAFRR
jgi:hypothetical protein